MRELVLIAGLSVMAWTGSAFAQSSSELTRLMDRAETQSGRRQVETYQEACALISAEACLRAAQLGQERDRNGVILSDADQAALGARACELGGAEICYGAARLNAYSDIAQGSVRRRAQLSMLLRACDGRVGEACRQVSAHYEALGVVSPDLSLARDYALRGCALGIELSCRDAEKLDPAQPERFDQARRMSRLNYQINHERLALNDQEVGEAGDSVRRANTMFSPNDKRERYTIYRNACDQGMARACFEFAYTLTYHDQSLRNLAERQLPYYFQAACDLGSSAGCSQLGKSEPLIGMAGQLEYLDRACFDGGDPRGCLAYSDYVREHGDLDRDGARAMEAVLDYCAFRRQSRDQCEQAQTLAALLTPEARAARAAHNQDLARSHRIVPFAAYPTCIAQAATPNASFLTQCAGTYSQMDLAKACQVLDEAARSTHLLCQGVVDDLNRARYVQGPVMRDGLDLKTHFRVLPDVSYLAQGEAFTIAALDPFAQIRTRTASIPSSLFDSSGPQAVTQMGDVTLRLVMSGDHLSVYASLDPSVLQYQDAVATLVLLPEGTHPSQLEGDSAHGPAVATVDTWYAQEISARARFDEAAGRWQVETYARFAMTPQDWDALARSDLYAQFNALNPAANGGVCCGYTYYIPFARADITPFAITQTPIARLYGGEVTPDIAAAMRDALNVDAEQLWSASCGYRPMIALEEINPFGNRVDQDGLVRAAEAYDRRFAWYNCQVAAYNAKAQDIQSFIRAHAGASPNDPLRWQAALRLQRANGHVQKLQQELRDLNAAENAILAASREARADNRRAASSERQARRIAAREQAERYLDSLGPQQHLDCLAAAYDYASHEACMRTWLNAPGAVYED